MPFSDPTAHPILERAIRERCAPGDSFLDCGVGCGLTGRIIREACDAAKITGLEIYAPYVIAPELRETQRREWGLHHDLYDSLILGAAGDFRVALYAMFQLRQRFEFVVFGDSLEHVRENAAVDAVWSAKAVATKAVLVSIPLERDIDGVPHVCPQGTAYGNPHEAHVKHWRREELEELGLKFVDSGRIASVFAWDR